ncbi:MAG: hypothetical protein ACFB10_09250 [Salibacteraceae bacterium]
MKADHNEEIVTEVLRVRDSLVEALNQRAKQVAYLSMRFPDVASSDFDLILNQWIPLPDTVSSGVKVIALEMKPELLYIKVDYAALGYIVPHYHSREDETIEVVSGSIRDEVHGLEFREGETYFIPRGSKHHITSPRGATLLITFHQPKA